MTSEPDKQVLYSPMAQLQLGMIRADRRFSEDARRAKIAEIVAACENTARHPLRYALGADKTTRERRVHPFKIVYSVRDAGIEIVAVWHDRQSRRYLPGD